MTTIFAGKDFARELEQKTHIKVKRLVEKGVRPKLVSILVGDDPGSVLYTNLKKQAAQRVGIDFETVRYPAEVPISRLSGKIKELNGDDKVHGIMVQLPLPGKLKSVTEYLVNQIAPKKDVDGLTNDSPYISATVKAILEILDQSPIANYLSPKICVVGASGAVGNPLVKELKKRYSDLVGCNSKTRDLGAVTKTADVLISAAGVPGLVKADMVKDGAIVIDVGSPKGDVDPVVLTKASFVTPVPGGVGPVTISCLLENLVSACK